MSLCGMHTAVRHYTWICSIFLNEPYGRYVPCVSLLVLLVRICPDGAGSVPAGPVPYDFFVAYPGSACAVPAGSRSAGVAFGSSVPAVMRRASV